MMPTAKIMLASGEVLDILDPDPDLILIDDIALALSRLCRFTGHSKRFYSVAEHCVLVSHLVPERLALRGLLHDAAEAYMGDMNSPLKQTQPTFSTAERFIEGTILRKFGLTPGVCPDAPMVKQADLLAASIEAHELMPHGEYWNVLPPPEPPPWHLGKQPNRARELFLRQFKALTK